VPELPEGRGAVDLSMVIPAYNEARRLPPTLARLRDYLDAGADSYEVLVVDDGSDDDTVAVARAVAREWPQLEVLTLPDNQGKGAAVREGMLRARGALRAFSDADLSTPIEELPRLRSHLGGACHVAIASRDAPGSDIQVHQPRWREFMGRSYNRILRLLVLPGIRDTQCGFKAFTAATAIDLFSRAQIDGWAFDLEILALARRRGHRIDEVAVTWSDDGRSRVSPLADLWKVVREAVTIRRNLSRGVYGALAPAA
jgi:dolichyl-phosphate beta-glucosyltransferase